MPCFLAKKSRANHPPQCFSSFTKLCIGDIYIYCIYIYTWCIYTQTHYCKDPPGFDAYRKWDFERIGQLPRNTGSDVLHHFIDLSAPQTLRTDMEGIQRKSPRNIDAWKLYSVRRPQKRCWNNLGKKTKTILLGGEQVVMIRMRGLCTTAVCHTVALGRSRFEDGKVSTVLEPWCD